MKKAEAIVEKLPEPKEHWFFELLSRMDPDGNLYDEVDPSLSESPIVGAVIAYQQPINGLRLFMQIHTIIAEFARIWIYWASNYYYYNLSKAFFKLCTVLFVMIDHVGQLNIIVPTPVWNRYRTNA